MNDVAKIRIISEINKKLAGKFAFPCQKLWSEIRLYQIGDDLLYLSIHYKNPLFLILPHQVHQVIF